MVQSEFEERFGFPPGDNTITDAEPGESARVLGAALDLERLPEGLLEFYEVFSRITMSDIMNAFYVGPPSWTAEMYADQGFRWVEDSESRREVIAIGSEGDGGMIVCEFRPDSDVYRLPQGAVSDGVYVAPQGASMLAYRVASSVDDFLEQLAVGAEHFLRTGDVGPFD